MKAHDATFRLRIYLLLGFFCVLTVCLWAGGFHHQVIERDHHLAWAKRQLLKPVQLLPLRGRVLDRRGRPMAVSLKAGSVFAHPAAVPDPGRAARALSPLLDVEADRLAEKLAKDVSFVWLARQAPLAEAEAVEALGIEGVGVQTEGARYYPNRELAGHLLGFTGVDCQGLEGLEWAFNDLLQGRQGTLLLQRDARGRVLWREMGGEVERRSGYELHLSLDLRIQALAEAALAGAVERTGAVSGMVVVLDPRTGELLAMACAPTFNPNDYRGACPARWRNRAIRDAFEPGSTAKAFLLAAALEEGVVEEDDRFDCEEGEFRYGGRTIHDMEENGVLSVREIVVASSNIGVTKIADLLGPRRLWAYLRDFGFGSPTGFDLPNEAAGALRSWKTWKPIALATHAFGQGFSATALQLAMAYAALANGGFLMEPRLVLAIRNGREGRVVKRSPEVVRRVVSAQTARRVLDVLESVVEEGTGRRGRIPGYRVAGKTGTAQKFDRAAGRYAPHRVVVSFVGVVPAGSPELVVAVILDEPAGRASGGGMAAPVFREVAAGALRMRNVPPDRPVVAQGTLPLGRSDGTAWAGRLRPLSGGGAPIVEHGPETIPDVRALPIRAALRRLRGLPVDVRLEGSGTVIAQAPEAGSPLRDVRILTLKAADAVYAETGARR